MEWQRKQKRNGDHFFELRIQKRVRSGPQNGSGIRDPFLVPLSISIFPEGSKRSHFGACIFGDGEPLLLPQLYWGGPCGAHVFEEFFGLEDEPVKSVK